MLSGRRKPKSKSTLRSSTQRRRKLLNNHKKVLQRQRSYAQALFDTGESFSCR
ncbi:hypothetical protein GNP81_09825 [Aliivibrio fischeri]|uniref:hypothetical protein n=1 Tax=Aliivibrio fischeri TaxID=668 RepID=UPI0012D9947E|nr:hypothetical protein [Aliivibrio fischeri]MUK63761.1 hypothetical protein [Aliivibrio fischeri]MUL19513.1 hypothetical protein [Aliivibrio fischeri]MUL24905.1 hypothetical protein [Aliivibrio fischeri]